MAKSQVLVGMTDAAETSYALLLTSESEPVRAAQRLRHQVFYEDMGAVLGTPVAGRDVERIDAFCDHLVVVDRSGTVVGTDRLLPPERARAAGGLYSDDKFDLTTLAPLRPQLVETGRSCVHPNHRTGGVIGLMWAGLARYLLLTRTRWLGGCVNVPLGDGGALAAWVWQHLRTRHLAPVEHRVTPLRPWDPIGAPRLLRPTLPPLLRGYLRLGAQVCGPPAYGPSCHCADFFVLLDSERISQRYWRYFLGDPG